MRNLRSFAVIQLWRNIKGPETFTFWRGGGKDSSPIIYTTTNISRMLTQEPTLLRAMNSQNFKKLYISHHACLNIHSRDNFLTRPAVHKFCWTGSEIARGFLQLNNNNNDNDNNNNNSLAKFQTLVTIFISHSVEKSPRSSPKYRSSLRSPLGL